MNITTACSLLSHYPTALISDCLDRLQVLDASLRPISRHISFCGPAFPIEEYAGLNSTAHLAVAQIPSGYVLMINAQGYEERAVWGGILNFAAATREVAAVVVDGAVRDLNELLESPFPVFARAVTAAGPLKGEVGRSNVATSVGGVVTRPSDIVRGDSDGIVVIPYEHIEQVLEACEARNRLEAAMIENIKVRKMTPLGESLLLEREGESESIGSETVRIEL